MKNEYKYNPEILLTSLKEQIDKAANYHKKDKFRCNKHPLVAELNDGINSLSIKKLNFETYIIDTGYFTYIYNNNENWEDLVQTAKLDHNGTL